MKEEPGDVYTCDLHGCDKKSEEPRFSGVPDDWVEISAQEFADLSGLVRYALARGITAGWITLCWRYTGYGVKNASGQNK
jgi:hypothetical protein